jgi:hypothetical protein
LDANRFDDLSRSLGRLITRRSAVRGAGAAGIAGVALAAGSMRRAAAYDNDATGAKDLPGTTEPISNAPNQCTFGFTAAVYHGPSAGLELNGELVLDFDPEGRVDGTLTTLDGDIAVVGQATGRALHVLFDLGDGKYISGYGNADSDVRDCAFTTIVGPFVGPYLSDVGAWGPQCPCLGRPGCTNKPPHCQ